MDDFVQNFKEEKMQDSNQNNTSLTRVGNDDGPVLIVRHRQTGAITPVQPTSTQSPSWISKLNPLNWLPNSKSSQQIIVEKVDLNAQKEPDEQNPGLKPDSGTSHDELAAQGQNATPPVPSALSTENSYEEDAAATEEQNFYNNLNTQESTYAELPLDTAGNTTTE